MKRYLGDGVYAEWPVRGMLLLTAQGDDRLHEIYLEPEVYQALLAFVEFVKKEFVKHASQGANLSNDHCWTTAAGRRLYGTSCGAIILARHTKTAARNFRHAHAF